MRRPFLGPSARENTDEACNRYAGRSLRYRLLHITTASGFRFVKMGIFMKKIVLIAAVAGLLPLTACGQSPEAANVEAAADNVGDQIDANATAIDAAADNAGVTAPALENQADAMHDQADATREAGEEKADAIDEKK